MDRTTSCAASNRGAEPIRFWLPENFEPEKLLPPDLWTCADEARYLVDQIGRKLVCRDVDLRGFAHLHSDVLKLVMRPNYLAPIVLCLEDAGVIETSPYSVGRYSRGFKLTEELLSQWPRRVACTDLRLRNRILSEWARLAAERSGRKLPIHGKLDHAQRRVTVTEDVDEMLTRLEPHARYCQAIVIDKIRRGDYLFSIGPQCGRCFNCLTGIKRPLRSAVRIDGQPMASVDLCCAQPALLALLIDPQKPPFWLLGAQTYKVCGSVGGGGVVLPPLPCSCLAAAELERFAELVCCGKFFEWLVEATGLDRGTVKLRFLIDVLAKRGRYPASAVEQCFKEAFPGVYSFIKAVNRHDHGTLIRLLQQLEAWLVIEKVAPRLVDRIPIVTLHDAIFCRDGDETTVEAAFQETFKEIGFSMKTKPEWWGRPTTSRLLRAA